MAVTAFGNCFLIKVKIDGKYPSSSFVVGSMVWLLKLQLFDVAPCCSGPAPDKILAQFGALTDGITLLVLREITPWPINLFIAGVLAYCKLSADKPSIPIRITCFDELGWAIKKT